MSSQDNSESVDSKPLNYPNTPSINDEPKMINEDDSKMNDNKNNEQPDNVSGSLNNTEIKTDSLEDNTDNGIKNVRSESVIKSPSKSSSSATPVIQVIDTSSQNVNDSECNNDATTSTKRSQTNSETCQTPAYQTQTSSSALSSGNFLKPIIAPNNPFLRATSFHSNSTSTCPDNSDSNSENQIIFAPPMLIPTSNKYETNFLAPSILKTSESNINDLKKPSETISTSKTFISLNKEDIGTIKAPEFIKNNPLISNGSNMESTNENCQPSTSETTSKATFLFGQKLEDRVVLDSSFSNLNNDLKSSETNKLDHLISFSDVTKCEETVKNTSNDLKTEDGNGENCSSSGLIKNGDDNNSNVFKRKYEVITGEEDEQNVLTIYGKLFAWDTEKASWVEKGRGHLRLNDVMKNERLCSRLVMRTAGALRLILNAHVVVGMTFELASENCLRFTYVDGIYMIKANPKDIDQLHSAIEHRLREISKKIKTSDKNESE